MLSRLTSVIRPKEGATFFLSDRAPLAGAPEPWRLHAFSGVAFVDGVMHSSDFNGEPPLLDVDQLLPAPGEWAAVLVRNQPEQQFMVVADSVGFQPVFYSHAWSAGLRRVDIGLTFAALSSQLVRSGIELAPNWSLFLQHLFSRHMLLSTAATDYTFASNVRILGRDSALVITPSGCEVTLRPGATVPGQGSYASALAEGREQFLTVLRGAALLNTDDRRISLSGGRDSRVVLAGLAALGIAKDFEVHTADPASHPAEWGRAMWRRDHKIASVLRDRFGMQWASDRASQRFAFSFKEAIWAWQRCFSNWNFNIDLAGRRLAPFTTRVSLRGGGGELLRSTNVAQFLAEQVQGAASREEAVRKVAERIVTFHSVLEAENVADVTLLADDISSDQSQSLVDVLNQYYARHRNRAHFGSLRSSLGRNELALNPLASRALLGAAGALDSAERESGAVIFDLIETLAPELNRIPFDDGYWPAAFAESRISGEFMPVEDVHAPANAPVAKEQEPAKTSLGSPVDVGGEILGKFPARDVAEAGRNFVRWGFRLILEAAPPEYSGQLERLERRLVYLVDHGGLPVGQSVAKIASMLDVLSPDLDPGVCIERCVGPVDQSAVSSHGLRLPASTDTPPIYRGNVLELAPKIAASGTSLVAEAGAWLGGDESFEFAFYLMSGDKRVATRWYSPSRSHTFDGPFESGTYLVRAFARSRNRPDLVFQRDSEPLGLSTD